ncbi:MULTISPECIES: UDP-4-amino-4,6-dideoxy-N-acetyl-beta-L-altrosamine N-acetyltransferase [unclassified Helicobacter]|uniref:UDP-4-amino-4, 6-dideoxy-N-acetyl-beta-L-altrosamine N-acetyltransferase n=1 Tax=unclassified Helicobacter TaxID=2593540 RepID=UPI001F15EA8F|nr:MULTISPECIES: UDP-4-amino-4,6-dideoxy-N-acetyl-beta-L-altrosamine N-acetyltransferase [unclassified Helicobacter]
MIDDISGIRVINFVSLNQEDVMEVFYLRNHPEITKWAITQNISLKEHLEFVQKLKNDSTKCYFLLKREKVTLGVVSLSRINVMHKNAYIGIYKNPALNKVGKDLLMVLEEIAFKKMKLHSLFLEVLEDNVKAIAFYQKNGYSYQGCLKDFMYYNHQYKDVLIYEKIQ